MWITSPWGREPNLLHQIRFARSGVAYLSIPQAHVPGTIQNFWQLLLSQTKNNFRKQLQLYIPILQQENWGTQDLVSVWIWSPSHFPESNQFIPKNLWGFLGGILKGAQGSVLVGVLRALSGVSETEPHGRQICHLQGQLPTLCTMALVPWPWKIVKADAYAKYFL